MDELAINVARNILFADVMEPLALFWKLFPKMREIAVVMQMLKRVSAY